MPRLKMEDDEFDIDELENAEYDDSKRVRYNGEIPPKDTVLLGYVKNLWLTETQNGDRMIKLLWVADGNEGDLEEYNGLPAWENMAMTAKSKFKWAPFFEHFGLTVRMFAKQTMLAADDDNVGAPITKIGKFAPGEDSKAARCAIITDREKYNGSWQARIAEWLDEDEVDQLGEEEEEEPEEEELEDEDEDEDEEEPPPPARTRRAASGTSSARPATKSAAASRSAGTKESAAKTSGTVRTAAKAPTRTAKTAARPARGKGRAADGGYDEEPPF